MHTTRRKVRSHEDARCCLEAAERSGLGRAEWARRNGVDARSLHAWFLNTGGRRVAAVRFVEVLGTPLAERRYVVRLGDVAIEVGDDFDDDVLRRLVAVVAAC